MTPKKNRQRITGRTSKRTSKRTTAVVIKAKQVLNIGCIIIALFVILWVMVLCGKSYNIFQITTNDAIDFICESITPFEAVTNVKHEDFLEKGIKMVLGYDFSQPVSLFRSQIALAGTTQYDLTAMTASIELASHSENPTVIKKFDYEPVPSEAPKNTIPENANPIVDITISPSSSKGYDGFEKILIKNETTYNPDIEKLFNQPLKWESKKEGPKVLIVHSHTSEAYSPTDVNYYTSVDPDRTNDTRFNVVRVGDEMERIFKEQGIEVIHDHTINDSPYNSSYKNSLKVIESYLAKYPSIEVVLDLHRDSMVNEKGEKLKVTADIEGKKAAQVMVLVGTDQGGLKNPNWEQNLSFALKIQAELQNSYPSLARPLNLRKERFNMHATKGSILLEMGSSGNTLEEAILCGEYTATAISAVIKRYS